MNFLLNTKVLVLGLGDSGLAMAHWCLHAGAAVSVWDSRAQAPQETALAALAERGVQRLAALPAPSAALPDYGLILKSPGLAPHLAGIAPLLAQARQAGVLVWGELDLFAKALADLKAQRHYDPQVLAITGTNGKTTVTAMTTQLVARCGKQVVAAGNIGPSLLATLQQQLAVVDAAQAQRDEEDRAAQALVEEGQRVQLEAAAQAAVQATGDGGPADGTDVSEAAPVVNAATSGAAPLTGQAEVEEDDRPPLPQLPEVWVLELSSFQLEGGGDGVVGFEPDAAVVLNVTQDHLDWHGSMQAYTAAKARVFGSQGVMIINLGDDIARGFEPKPAVAAKGKFGKPAPKALERSVLRFGPRAPQRPGDFGLLEEGGMVWLARALPGDQTIKPKKRAAPKRLPLLDLAAGVEENPEPPPPAPQYDDDEPLYLQRLMPADALHVRGRHNASNALAALALGTAVGCPLAPMLHALRDYRGEPHRLQFVAVVDGVEAYDDSKATNVGATVAALEGLGADKAPSKLVLVLGGDGKGQDFAPLVQPLLRYARAVATIGRDAPAVEAAIAAAVDTAAAAGSDGASLVGERSALAVQRCATLQEAVAWCFARAHSGDAVLLSPACASLDMFNNYAHRAEVFVQAVQAHAADRGQA